jgi:hypothetical protein
MGMDWTGLEPSVGEDAEGESEEVRLVDDSQTDWHTQETEKKTPAALLGIVWLLAGRDLPLFFTQYSYEHARASLKDWVGLILRFIKSVIKNVSLLTETSPTTKKIISRKYSIYVKSRIWTWMN